MAMRDRDRALTRGLWALPLAAAHRTSTAQAVRCLP